MLKRLDLKLQKIFFAHRLEDTMPNLNPKKAEPLTAAQIRAYAEEVDEVLRMLRRAEAEALKQEGQILNTYGIASYKTGIERLRAFADQLDNSRYRSATGNPVKEGERQNKRRSED